MTRTRTFRAADSITLKVPQRFQHTPLFGVFLLALLGGRGRGRRWRAFPLLGAARLLVPPFVRRGHLICERLGRDPLPLWTALSHFVVLLVHPLVVLVQV